MQPVVHVQVTRKPANKAVPVLGMLVFVALFVSSCVGKYMYAMSAPPIAKTIALVEKDPTIAAELGAPVSISFSVRTSVTRDIFGSVKGIDKAYVDTPIKGPKGEAKFDLVARNVENQGWAGTFSVKLNGRSVLKNGGYVQEGARVLISGDFAPDGTPRIEKNR
jgi:hypothetical protein